MGTGFLIPESTERILIIFTYRDSEFVAFDPADEIQGCVLPIFHLPGKQTSAESLAHRNVFKDGDIIERYRQIIRLSSRGAYCLWFIEKS